MLPDGNIARLPDVGNYGSVRRTILFPQFETHVTGKLFRIDKFQVFRGLCRESFGIQNQLSRKSPGPSTGYPELVFVVIGEGWQCSLPGGFGAVDRPEVPDVHANVHDLSVVLADDSGFLPVVVHARSVQQRHRIDRVVTFCTHRRHMHHECDQSVVCLARCNERVVEIGHAAQADSTGRSVQEDETHPPGICIEVVPERLKFVTHDDQAGLSTLPASRGRDGLG